MESFDVFDTAVTRAVAWPDHVHWLVAAAMSSRGAAGFEPLRWRRTRIQAEEIARQRSEFEEITLADIYAVIAESGEYTPLVLHEAREEEVFQEENICFPIEVVRQKTEKVSPAVFVSDMYLPKSVVSRILTKCDYDVDDERLFVSSEMRSTKRSGRLYRDVADRLGEALISIRHTGDNEESDIRTPKRLGVQTSPFRHSRPNQYEVVRQSQRPEILPSIIAGCSRVSRLSFGADGRRQDGILTASACVAGPLLTSFVMWTLTEALRRGVGKVWYLARDGQIMVRIAEEVCKSFKLPIQPKYLLASRQALLLPSLVEREDRFDVIANEASAQSLRTMLQKMEIGEHILSSLCVDGRVLRRELASVLRGHSESVDRHINCEKDALIRYLEQQGFLSAATSIIVDVGWKGSLQTRLQRAVGAAEAGNPPMIVGLYLGLVHTPQEIRGKAFTFCGSAPPGEVIETFCAADHVSLQSYSDLETRCSLSQDRPALDWGVRLQQSAISKFTSTLCTVVCAQPNATLIDVQDELKSIGIRNLWLLIKNPGYSEALAYGQMQHAADAGHVEYNEIGPQLRFEQLVRMFLPRRLRGRKMNKIWVEASLARTIKHAKLRDAVLKAWRLRSREKLVAIDRVRANGV